MDHAIAVAAQLGAQIIADDPEDVRAIGSRAAAGANQRREAGRCSKKLSTIHNKVGRAPWPAPSPLARQWRPAYISNFPLYTMLFSLNFWLMLALPSFITNSTSPFSAVSGRSFEK
jgi:hypothetical protein